MSGLNKMAKGVRQLESYLPSNFRSLGYSLLFNNMVKLAGKVNAYI